VFVPVEAEGIRVEMHRRSSDRAMVAAMRAWRRKALGAALALPFILFFAYAPMRRVGRAFKEDPVGEALIFGVVLTVVAVLLVRSMRRQWRRPNVAGQLWCSMAVYPGPHDIFAGGFGGSPDFARRLMEAEMVPVVHLVLTATQFLIVPTEGDDPPLRLNLSDVATVAIISVGRRENGVTITRRDGQAAAFVCKPDQNLVRELERLGATVA
jgi:hypothetical protein